MNRGITAKLRRLLSRRQLKHRLAKAAMVLSCMAVFCVTYMLVAPVLTQEWPAVCGLEEHVHTDACYTVELVPVEPEEKGEEPAAQPEVQPEAETEPGHTHTDGCYTETTVRELTCTEAEAEGHTHSDGCYETTSSLICTDESEEHVHGEECYETVTTLTCTLAETEGHTHSDACYTETTTRELTCGLTESEPQAPAEPAAEPETQPETETEPETEAEPQYKEVRVLTCGLEEHTHDDTCYHQESDEVRYYCDLEEHTHGEDCYFESGELRCTIPEHTHTDECTVRPEPEAEAQRITLDNTYTAQRDDVTFTLTVQGEAELPAETAQPETDGEVAAEPAAETETETETATETETETETEIETETETETVLPAPEELELVVTECEDEAVYQTYEELAAENGEVMMVQVLNYSLNWNGQALDLSGCELAVELAPTEEFQSMLDASPDAALMTVDNDLTDGELVDDESFSFAAYTQEEVGVAAYAVSRGANPHFTVQYYANLERAVKTNNKDEGVLPIINTDNNSTGKDETLAPTGGQRPKNGTGINGKPTATNPIAYLSLTEDGMIVTAPQLTEIYREEQFEYQRAPGLKYFNIVLNNSNSQYDLKEIWVLKPDANADSLNKNDWTIRPYSSALRFTNRKETADANPDFIFIDEKAVIRLVYDPKHEDKNFPANFYDYDITDMSDGHLYMKADARDTGKSPWFLYTKDNMQWNDALKSVSGTYPGIYLKTNQAGINSAGNYTRSGAKLAFGNGNTGNGLDGQYWDGSKMVHWGVLWNGNALNRYNAKSRNAERDSYQGCTFGLVTGLVNGKLQFADGVSAPKLFNEGSATGKTTFEGKAGKKYSLDFDRVGDTYTLRGVRGTNLNNLSKFSHPGSYSIWTNHFWPMDYADTWGAPNHDPKMGSSQNKSKIYSSDNSNMPESDDGMDHNAYFGMQYSVKFQLTSSYVGPLEYYFFGDDDMWVFLDDTLVCDIGGVHSSVGEYVNLWDYIDRRELVDENGQPKKVQKLDENNDPIQAKDKNGNPLYDEKGDPVWEMTDYVKEYTLSFFYTERGASGSTCWMQFTLPTVVGVDLDSALDQMNDTGAVSIEKRLEGVENTDWFTFQITGLKDSYVPTFFIRDANGTLLPNDELQNQGYILGGSDNIFKIRAGDVLVLGNLNDNQQQLTIKELDRDGYHTEIMVDDVQQDSEDTALVTIKPNQRVSVVFTNVASYELPSTGGPGLTLLYTMGILTLTAAACLVYKKRKDTERGNAM